MVSAYNPNHDTLENMIDTERLYDRLEHHYHVHAIRAIKVQYGLSTQAFVIHTNSQSTMVEVKRLALDVYHQDFVIVRNNRKHDVQLHDNNANTNHVGKVFTHDTKSPKNAPIFIILNGADYWSIK